MKRNRHEFGVPPRQSLQHHNMVFYWILGQLWEWALWYLIQTFLVPLGWTVNPFLFCHSINTVLKCDKLFKGKMPFMFPWRLLGHLRSAITPVWFYVSRCWRGLLARSSEQHCFSSLGFLTSFFYCNLTFVFDYSIFQLFSCRFTGMSWIFFLLIDPVWTRPQLHIYT